MNDENMPDQPTHEEGAEVATLHPEGGPPAEETPNGVFVRMVPTEGGGVQPQISALGNADVLQVLTILKLAVVKHEADLGLS